MSDLYHHPDWPTLRATMTDAELVRWWIDHPDVFDASVELRVRSAVRGAIDAAVAEAVEGAAKKAEEYGDEQIRMWGHDAGEERAIASFDIAAAIRARSPGAA